MVGYATLVPPARDTGRINRRRPARTATCGKLAQPRHGIPLRRHTVAASPFRGFKKEKEKVKRTRGFAADLCGFAASFRRLPAVARGYRAPESRSATCHAVTLFPPLYRSAIYSGRCRHMDNIVPYLPAWFAMNGLQPGGADILRLSAHPPNEMSHASHTDSPGKQRACYRPVPLCRSDVRFQESHRRSAWSTFGGRQGATPVIVRPRCAGSRLRTTPQPNSSHASTPLPSMHDVIRAHPRARRTAVVSPILPGGPRP